MKTKKRLELYFHRETGLPIGNDSGLTEPPNPDSSYHQRRPEEYERALTRYQSFEKREVPIWYDIMKFFENRPSNVPVPDRMDDWYRYGYGNRPKFYVESIHWDSPYYERWFRILGPDLRKMLSGKYGPVYVVDGVLAGYWTFTRGGNQVGVRYLGQQDPTINI